jgi:hypothetical protein
VLALPEFGEEKTESSYELRRKPPPETEAPDRDFDPALIMKIAEVFAWFVVALLLGLVGYWLVRALPLLSSTPSLDASPSARRGLGGVVEEARSTGTDLEGLLERARRFAREGRALEALSLLYLGSLVTLSDRFDLAVSDDATEGECLRAVRRRAPSEDAGRFAAVTRAWQLAAYRGELPDRDELGRLLDLAAPLVGNAR